MIVSAVLPQDYDAVWSYIHEYMVGAAKYTHEDLFDHTDDECGRTAAAAASAAVEASPAPEAALNMLAPAFKSEATLWAGEDPEEDLLSAVANR